jgi:DNA-binding beta-propeller fold protein YncE
MLGTGLALLTLSFLGACAGADGGEASGDETSGGAAVATLTSIPTFEPDPAWPVLPPDFEWGQVIGIAADSRGQVWTSSRSTISEWDPEGNLVQSWSARGPDDAWQVIHGLFIDHNDFVWTNARESNLTLKFTRDGRHVLTIGRLDETGGSNDTSLMGRPAEIWVDPADNEVFVADGYGNRRVIVFDGETGAYLRHWGAYGEAPDDEYRPDPMSQEPPQQLRTPHGIAGSRDGMIYVADRANNRIQVFRQDGTFVAEKILRPRCAPDGEPEVPGCAREAAFSLGFSHDQAQTYLYVADGGSHVIVVIRRSDLEKVAEFGGPGTGSGQLGRPHNLAVDPRGNIFVAEAAGPWIVDSARGDSVQAGFRAQRFALTGAGGQ